MKKIICLIGAVLMAGSSKAQTIVTLDGKKKVQSVKATEKPDTYTQADTVVYRRLVMGAYHALRNDSFAVAKMRFEKALKTAPRMETNVEVLYELGQLEERESRHRSAIGYYTQAIKRNPGYSKAFLRRGGMYLLLNDERMAIKDFNSVIALDSRNNDALFFRGCAYANLAEFQNAASDFEALLERNPLDERAVYSLALIEIQQKKYEDALIRMNGLILRYPGKSMYYAKRADVEESLLKLTEAGEDWEKAMDLSLKDVGLAGRYVSFLLRQGRKEDAYKVIDRVENAGVPYTELEVLRQKVKRAKKK